MKCLPSPFLSLAPLPLFSTLLLFQYAFNMFMVTSTPVNVGQLTFKRAWVRGDDFLLLITCSHMGGKRYSLQFLVDGPCELAHTLVCELIVPIRWVSREENVNFFEGTFSEKLKKKKKVQGFTTDSMTRTALTVIFLRCFSREQQPLTITQLYHTTQNVCKCWHWKCAKPNANICMFWYSLRPSQIRRCWDLLSGTCLFFFTYVSFTFPSLTHRL